MYVLERGNIVKKTDSKHKAEGLQEMGYTLISAPEEKTSGKKKEAAAPKTEAPDEVETPKKETKKSSK